MTLNGQSSMEQFSSGASHQASGGTVDPSGAMRNRRVGRPSPEIDVWYNPSQQNSAPGTPLHLSPQPQITFPVSGHSSPASHSPSDSPYSDEKLSPMFDGPKLPRGKQPAAGLSWREAVSDPRRRTGRKSSSISMQQIALGGGALAALILLYFLFRSEQQPAIAVSRMGRKEHDRVDPKPSSIPTSSASSSRKAPSFRDELSHDMKYITSPPSGDLGEQVVNFYHLTRLSQRLARLPLIPPFVIPNTSGEDITIPFSTLFDMPRFSQATSVSAVDWNDIRQPGSSTDGLGCWAGAVSKENIGARTYAMRKNGVDASFFPMRAPSSRADANEQDRILNTFEFLASFEQDEPAQNGLIEQAYHSKSATSLTSKVVNPETHIFCIDSTLYRTQAVAPVTSAAVSLDLVDFPAWQSHGKALHFLPELQDMALNIAAYLLGHRGAFMAIHISAAGWKAACEAQNGQCGELRLQPYVEAVDRARHLAIKTGKKSRELRHNVRALSVLVATDVADISFRGEIAAAGWTLVDYEDLELRHRFGQWIPDVMDPVIHSKAVAFVGTRGSSKSTLSALRVKTWRGGPVDLV